MGLMAMLLLAGCAAPSAQEPLAHAPEASAAAAAPAAAAQPAAPEQPVATQAAAVEPRPDDNEIVCRTEKPLGTRIGKRVCKSRAQARTDEAAAREMMNNRDRKSHGVTDPATGGG
jgi:hypothetical protein